MKRIKTNAFYVDDQYVSGLLSFIHLLFIHRHTVLSFYPHTKIVRVSMLYHYKYDNLYELREPAA